MTMQTIGRDPWPLRFLSEGWHVLRDKAHQALTYFSPKEEEKDSVTQRWGLVATDVVDHKGHLEVRTEIPGMNKQDLAIEVVGQHLIISGEKRSESTRREGTVVVTERAFGRFRRAVLLPVGVDASKANAKYRDGVLVLHLPKAVRSDTRRIEVTS